MMIDSTTDSTAARELFETRFDLIDSVIRRVCSRHFCRPQDAEDFHSFVVLALLEHDCRILRRFRGKSRLKTYLVTVVSRLRLDYERRQWGRWKVSAKAKQLGSSGRRLDVLLHRDGFTLEDAIEILKRNEGAPESRSELRNMAARLVPREQRHVEGEEVIERLPLLDDGEWRLMLRQAGDDAVATARIVDAFLEELPAADRVLLHLRFSEGWSVPKIGRALGSAPRQLYSRLDRCLKGLRQHLTQAGIGPEASPGSWEDLLEHAPPIESLRQAPKATPPAAPRH